jgi:hypothetical protein
MISFLILLLAGVVTALAVAGIVSLFVILMPYSVYVVGIVGVTLMFVAIGAAVIDTLGVRL